MKITKRPKGASFSDDYLQARAGRAPPASMDMANSVSSYRKHVLGEEVKHGLYSDGSNPSNGHDTTYNSNVVSMVKQAQIIGGDGGAGGWGGGGIGNMVLQIPEIYSPLWLTSNLNLPRDRATINAWCRAYFALWPIVQNAIQLHSTYPISKLNIKCSDPK